MIDKIINKNSLRYLNDNSLIEGLDEEELDSIEYIEQRDLKSDSKIKRLKDENKADKI